jgi:hypothetical protein
MPENKTSQIKSKVRHAQVQNNIKNKRPNSPPPGPIIQLQDSHPKRSSRNNNPKVVKDVK